MSGKGNCFDNAMVETFFKTLKAELVWRTIFQSRIEAASAIGRYIDGFYNPVRRHSALNFISPLQFEGQAAKIENALHKCRESPEIASMSGWPSARARTGVFERSNMCFHHRFGKRLDPLLA